MSLDNWIEHLSKGYNLNETDFESLCELAKEILFEEPNVLQLRSPLKVCGDIHGQLFDVLKLFQTGGPVGSVQYLFLGDYVDRGYHSIETISLLLAYKVKFPTQIYLLRGNHESRQVTRTYGFYEECISKYGSPNVWRICNEVFDYLPLSAIVDGTTFCVHAGLSPDLYTIDQIRTINRAMEIPNEGPFSDLMWSDPEEIENWTVSQRGTGWLFGTKPVEEFCQRNGVNFIVRSHQLVQEGYKEYFDGKLATVWSAPNYCYRCGNTASILELGENQKRNVEYFTESDTSRGPLGSGLPYFM